MGFSGRILQSIGWLLFGIDAAGVFALLVWALTASSREGESAYAIVFVLIGITWLGLGGGALLWSCRRRSALGVGCATLLLGLPPLLAVAIRVANSL